MRVGKFLAGLWLGTCLVAWPVAGALVYLCTGKVMVPGMRRSRLLSVDEANACLRATIRGVMERIHE